MKLLLCMHGNPLQGQEFDPLLKSLQESGFTPVIHKRPIKGSELEPLLQSVNATVKVSGGGPFYILAYSWGAYLALAYRQRFPENVLGMILVNPFFVDTKESSSIYKFFLATPIVRTIAIKLRCRAFASAYIKRLFSPSSPPQLIKTNLEAFLSHVPVWKGEAAYKKLMMSHPLSMPDQAKIPVAAIVGEMDNMAPLNEEKPYLDALGAYIEIIPGAGHALPWTHTQYIADIVRQECKL